MSLPPTFSNFDQRFPEVTKALEAAGDIVRKAGPLSGRECHLVKLAVAVATEAKGSVKSQARQALADGLSPDEVRQTALLALPTIGFPQVVAAMGWIDEVLAE